MMSKRIHNGYRQPRPHKASYPKRIVDKAEKENILTFCSVTE